MKKLFLTLGVVAMGISAYGYERVLYTQNFEGCDTPAEAGWEYQAVASIASDGEGKYLELNNSGQNGRSGQCSWGNAIYQNPDGSPILEDGKYTMSFEFSFKAFSSNQYDGCIDVFTNHTPIVLNQSYRMPWTSKGDGGVWENFIFDATQANDLSSVDTFYINAPTVKTATEDAETGETVYTYSIPAENSFTFTLGEWYVATMVVDTENRTVDWTIENLAGTESIYGTRTVPEVDPDGSDVSMFAEGMFIKTARTTCDMYLDNILITCETAHAYAGEPVVALTRVGYSGTLGLDAVEKLNLRGYTIGFGSAETLHYIEPGSTTEKTEDYFSCEGKLYKEYETSGKLIAWTTCDDATSEKVEVDVVCEPCVLPAATTAISSVNSGYVKTFTLNVDNSDVPLRPEISMKYDFAGVGGEKVEGDNALSGQKVPVTQQGTLTIETKAFGYKATTTSVENDKEFDALKSYDFARLTKEQYEAAGFTDFAVLNSSSTSGFNNWTARKRLYYYDVNQPGEPDADGNPTYAAVYPMGFVTADNEDNVIEYCVVPGGETVDKDVFFDGLTLFAAERNVGYLKHIGIYNDETANNSNDVTIHGITSKDYVVANIINNYGGNSCHPVVATTDEYYAQLAGEDAVIVATKIVVDAEDTDAVGEASNTLRKSEDRLAANSYSTYDKETGTYDVHLQLFRIDTALTKISIFSQVSGPVDDAVEGIEAEVAGDNYYYTIDGLRLAQPNRPGLYIHNGKKIIVK